ncbi:MAG TPA: hypothetical protein VK623_06465 [Flavobacterium sp.]|nr:hypothetical protein [Flavobacterium sp.]
MKTSQKKTIALLAFPVLFAGMLALIPSCSKDDDSAAYVCATCNSTPNALAANDASAKGIYKGILVGSTGTISINIQNGSDLITATMVIDADSVALTSTVSVVNGETYIAPFTGIYNGSPVSVTFEVGPTGDDPFMVSSDIPGHPNMVFKLYKETSTSLIEAFQGMVTNQGEPGTFNFIVARSLNVWGYVVQSDDPSEPASTGNGTISGNDLIEDGHTIGTINGDVIHGSFQDNNSHTIVIDGHRTL